MDGSGTARRHPVFTVTRVDGHDQRFRGFGLRAPAPGTQRNMIGFLVAGLIIGLVARLLLPGRQKIGLLWTLVLGVIGSLIGGTIANALRSGSIWELNFVGCVAAVVASVVVLAVAERSGLLAGRDSRQISR
jgi:uncharacterized membrane protein YeaQ/YmgE (transglycosylase-associated protein family)